MLFVYKSIQPFALDGYHPTMFVAVIMKWVDKKIRFGGDKNGIFVVRVGVPMIQGNRNGGSGYTMFALRSSRLVFLVTVIITAL